MRLWQLNLVILAVIAALCFSAHLIWSEQCESHSEMKCATDLMKK